jgi:hypothetical protein
MRWNGSEPVPEINRRVAASMVKEKREGRKDRERERERDFILLILLSVHNMNIISCQSFFITYCN